MKLTGSNFLTSCGKNSSFSCSLYHALGLAAIQSGFYMMLLKQENINEFIYSMINEQLGLANELSNKALRKLTQTQILVIRLWKLSWIV